MADNPLPNLGSGGMPQLPNLQIPQDWYYQLAKQIFPPAETALLAMLFIIGLLLVIWIWGQISKDG